MKDIAHGGWQGTKQEIMIVDALAVGSLRVRHFRRGEGRFSGNLVLNLTFGDSSLKRASRLDGAMGAFNPLTVDPTDSAATCSQYQLQSFPPNTASPKLLPTGAVCVC